ncbi:unnamed protein product, partial [Prorocentrum cordatum]
CIDRSKRKVPAMLREVPVDRPSPESDELPLLSPALAHSLPKTELAEVGARTAQGAAPMGAMEGTLRTQLAVRLRGSSTASCCKF